MSEAQFLREVVRRTGCGLLLDVNNALRVAQSTTAATRWAFIDALPLRRSARSTSPALPSDHDAAGAPLLIDNHGAPVDEAVWGLYART